ncbi:MAG TPA: S8 family serine peptidase [Blastocatellia bacterium]|nr:S8 family serine peptidase [Blastocatellia bacterium]
MRHSTKTLLILFILGCLVCADSLSLAARSSPAGSPFVLPQETLTIADKKAYIVLFKDASLADYRGQIRGLPATNPAVAPANRREGKLNLQSEASRRYLSYLEAQHEAFARRLRQRAPDALVGDHYHIVLNGMAVAVPENQVAALARLPEVAALAPIHEYQLLAAPAPPLDVSPALMGAADAWQATGGPENAGRGIKIGIIDSGVDVTNPMFIDPSLTPPAGFPKTNDPNLTLPPGSKIIVAKFFQSLKDQSNPNLHPGHATALDLIGHGTHVAAAAAGNFVDLRSTPGARPVTLSGVAPKAFIGSYRVFAPSAETDNVVKAIEEAVADGMDIINLSFGHPVLPSDRGAPDAFVEAVTNAVAAGVFVTVAAGNFGGRGTITSPGTAPSVLTVGAVTNSHDGFTPGQLRQVRITTPAPPPTFTRIVGVRSERFPDSLTAPVVDADLIDDGIADGDGYGCTLLPAAIVRGTALLVQKGRCDILVKALNANLRGATALIVYNNQEGGETLDSLAGLLLPTLFLPRSSGLALKNLVDANAATGQSTVVQLAPAEDPLTFDRQPHVLADFSSRGPTPDLLIKPDLVTIGAGSYGPAQADDPRGESRFPRPDPGSPQPPLYDPTGYVFASGTSFAAPRAAGAIALLKQLHPDWSPADLKAALMTSASRPTGPNEVGINRIMERGSGAIDLAAAVRVETIVTPPSHSFGKVIVSTPTRIVKEFTITNRSRITTTYTLHAALSLAAQYLKVQVTPRELTLPPGATATITLTLSIETDSVVQQVDSEGFLLISDGERTTPRPLYIPFWIRTAPS